MYSRHNKHKGHCFCFCFFKYKVGLCQAKEERRFTLLIPENMNTKEKALNEIERNFIKDLIFKEYTLSMNIYTFRIKDILNMCAQLLQSCSTVCNPVDSRPSGFSVNGILQQEYLSGVPVLSPKDLSNPGIELASPATPALAGRFFYH